jgi:uncharacterized protein YndB with AHSA1/START domain
MTPAHERLFSIWIDAPAEKVFREITRTTGTQRFYFDTVLEADLRPGGALRYRTPDGKRTFIRGEVVEIDAPRKFVHTFRFTHLPDAPTRVTFAIADEGTGVRLTVTHDKFEGETATRKSIASGWPFIIGNLKSELERGKLPVMTRVKYALMKLMMPLMPKTKDEPAKCAARAAAQMPA